LSVETDHVIVKPVWVALPICWFCGTEGGVVSATVQAAVAAVNVGRLERFPDASYASTASVYDVPQASPVKVYEVEVVLPWLVVPR
jgi:hypothetical protein